MFNSFSSFLNEEQYSDRVWYHGSSDRNLKKETIEIRDDSERMFFGDAFYITDDITLARRDGKYIYRVEFDGNFYPTPSLEAINSFGTFKNFLSRVFKDIRENILHKVMERPDYWQIKLRLSNRMMKELVVLKDTNKLAEKFIEAHIDELFDKYARNQMGLRDAFEERGYDGITDGKYIAIFKPQECIVSLEKVAL